EHPPHPQPPPRASPCPPSPYPPPEAQTCPPPAQPYPPLWARAPPKRPPPPAIKAIRPSIFSSLHLQAVNWIALAPLAASLLRRVCFTTPISLPPVLAPERCYSPGKTPKLQSFPR